MKKLNVVLVTNIIIIIYSFSLIQPIVFSDNQETYNLVLGKSYEKSIQPSSQYPDAGGESTDGIIAGDYMDSKSYGYNLEVGITKSVDITINLSTEPTAISRVRAHKWQGKNDYGADKITVYTSIDGINYTQVGSLTTPEGYWFNISFSTVQASYVRVDFNKTCKNAISNWLFIDEIEVYDKFVETPTPTPYNSNLAFGKAYKKSVNTDYDYPDKKYESTDGVLAGDYTDANSYGFKIAKDKTISVNITINLSKDPINISRVRVHKWEGLNNYGANKITVSTSLDNNEYKQVGSIRAPEGIWYNISFEETPASYVKVNFAKTCTNSNSNWLFIDEIEVYNDFAVKPTESPKPIQTSAPIPIPTKTPTPTKISDNDVIQPILDLINEIKKSPDKLDAIYRLHLFYMIESI